MSIITLKIYGITGEVYIQQPLEGDIALNNNVLKIPILETKYGFTLGDLISNIKIGYITIDNEDTRIGKYCLVSNNQLINPMQYKWNAYRKSKLVRRIREYIETEVINLVKPEYKKQIKLLTEHMNKDGVELALLLKDAWLVEFDINAEFF